MFLRRKLALSKRSHTLIYFSPLKEWLLKTWVLTMCYHFYFTRTKSFHSIYNLTRMQIMSMSNGTSTWLQANRDSNHWETWSSGRCHSKWLTPQYWILPNTGIYLFSIQMAVSDCWIVLFSNSIWMPEKNCLGFKRSHDYDNRIFIRESWTRI